MKGRKRRRLKQIKKRKNFFPALLITILLWFIFCCIVMFLNPSTFGAKPLFFASLGTALIFTLSLLFGNTKRGALTTIGILIYLFLRVIGIGNIVNLLLIFAVIIALDRTMLS